MTDNIFYCILLNEKVNDKVYKIQIHIFYEFIMDGSKDQRAFSSIIFVGKFLSLQVSSVAAPLEQTLPYAYRVSQKKGDLGNGNFLKEKGENKKSVRLNVS